MNRNNMEQSTAFNRRRNYNSRYEKPAWEIEKERAEKERREADERALQRTEENYPALGSVVAKPMTWSGRKFTELATEWKETEEKKKAIDDGTAPPEKNTDVFVMPMFRPSRFYAEEDDTPLPDNVVPCAPLQVASEDDGWVTVDNSAKKQARLIRKQARMEERLRRMDEGEDVPPENQDETSGDQDEEDESCWVAPQGKEYTT